MTTNEFFNKVIYISDNETKWQKIHYQCSKRNITVDKVDAIQASQVVVPRNVLFNATQLAELLTFYNIIRQANIDNLTNVFILKGNIVFCKDFELHAHNLFSELSYSVNDYDLIYLGCSDYNLKSAEYNKKQLVHPVFDAKGSFAIGINNNFYSLFLESARVPNYCLDLQINAISLMSRIYVAIPPLISLDARYSLTQN